MPHGLPDSDGEFGLEASVSHCLVERTNARGDLSAEFTVGELLHRSDLDDASLFVEVGGDHADATEDGAVAEAVDESVDVAHAVEDGIDHGVGADRGSHIVHCLIQGERLYAEKDDVEWGIEFFNGYGFGLEGEVSVRADDAQAFAAELLCAGGPDEKGDVASGLCETRSKVAADGAGTNDKNLRVRSAFLLPRVSRWLRSGGCWSGLWRSRGIDAGAHQKKEIDKKDRDEDEASDEDVWLEAHHGFVAGKIRRWEVLVLVIAFVGVFGHAHKLTSQMRGCDA
jgi:hypothetical protein